MKKMLLSFGLAFAMAGAAKAQSDYQSAIGIRLSSAYYDAVAASYKTFISDDGALEFNLGFRGHNNYRTDWVTAAFSAAYQHHFAIKPVEGLSWYVGGGLSILNSFSSESDYRGFNFGVFATGGVDYKFSNIPLNLSADFRPTLLFGSPYDDPAYHDRGYNKTHADIFGVSARYTFR